MKTLMLALLFFTVSFHLQAQQTTSSKYLTTQHDRHKNRPLFGVSGIYTFPLASLAQSGYSQGWGLESEYYSPNLIYRTHANWGVRIGGSFEATGQGRFHKHVLLHDPLNAPGTQNLSNSLLSLDIHTMLIREKGLLRPYLDLYLGSAYFISEQRLKIDHPVAGYQSSTITDKASCPLAYGLSLGCHIQLSESMFLNFKGTFQDYATSIRFMDLRNLSYDNHTYQPASVYVHPVIVSIQAGLVFKIPYSPARYSSSGGSSQYRSRFRGGCHGGGGGGGIPLR